MRQSRYASWEPTGLDEEVRVFGVMVEGGGGDILPGSLGYMIAPFTATVIGWDVIGEPAPGDIVFDVWLAPWLGPFPANPNSITGSGKPTLTAAMKAKSNNVTGWTERHIKRGEVLGFEVESVNNLMKATLTVRVLRTGN